MEEAGDKTENATPQKLRDAQEKGIALRSQELSVLVTLCLAAATVLVLLPGVAHHIAGRTGQWIAAAYMPLVPDNLGAVPALASPGFNLLLILFTAAAVLAVIAAAAYGGIRFSGFPLKPDFSRINPAKGFKRMFSMHTLSETAKALLKIVGLGVIAWLLARSALADLAMLQVAGIEPTAAILGRLTLKVLLWLIVLQLLFTAFDLWYANRRYLKQLRMSRRELKDEYRRQEGDPEIRRKRKQQQSALLAQIKALGNVKDSDVVVTNPTHVAVALKYTPASMDAPMVSCSGRGGMAWLIRRLARRHGVPVIRQPPLARALAQQRIGQTVDKEQQQQVVFIYRWLLSHPNKRFRLSP